MTVSGPVCQLTGAWGLAKAIMEKNKRLLDEGQSLPAAGGEFKGSEDRKEAGRARRALWEMPAGSGSAGSQDAPPAAAAWQPNPWGHAAAWQPWQQSPWAQAAAWSWSEGKDEGKAMGCDDGAWHGDVWGEWACNQAWPSGPVAGHDCPAARWSWYKGRAAGMAKGWAEGGWNGDSWSEGSGPWRGKSQGKAETKHTGSIKPGMEENSLRFKALLDWFDQGEWYRWGEAAQGRQRRW